MFRVFLILRDSEATSGKQAGPGRVGMGSGAALYLNRDDVHAVELLVAHGRRMEAQQPEREIVGGWHGGFVRKASWS